MGIITAFFKKQTKYHFFHLIRVVIIVKLQKNISVSESGKEKISKLQAEVS